MKLRVAVSNWMAVRCYRIGAWFDEASKRLSLCPDCGRSRYYGKPCEPPACGSVSGDQLAWRQQLV